MQSLETVYGTAFAYLQTLSGFKTISRRLQLVENVPAGEMPALYQHELNVDPKQVTMEGLAILEFYADWYIYVSAPNMQAPTTPLLNPLVDTVLAAFPNPNSSITIASGGNQITLSLNGSIKIYEGLLNVSAVAKIPVRMMQV